MLEISVSLVLFLFPLAYSPGPGNMFFAANAARFGFSATLSANIGYHLATLIVTLAFGFGFSWVAKTLPAFLFAIKYLGSAYVLYLAWGLFRAGTSKGQTKARHAGFRDGVFLFLLNPKAYLIIVLMFTQFTKVGEIPQTVLITLISTVFTLNNFLAFSIWAYIGDRLVSAFRRESYAQRLNIIFGTTLALVALWMLLN